MAEHDMDWLNQPGYQGEKLPMDAVIVPDTDGLFVVHRSLLGGRPISDHWTITHVPTGCSCRHDLPTRKSAIATAQELYQRVKRNPDIHSRGWRKAGRALKLTR